MPTPEKYKIVFYLRSSGAECTMEYDDKGQYDAATTFLNSRITAFPVSREGKRDPRSVYYVIEDQELAAFNEFMGNEGTSGR